MCNLPQRNGVILRVTSSSPTPKKAGQQAEDLAYRYLKNQGLVLIARNYTCRCGEIDLIMREKHTVVFIEVRYRQDRHFGHSLETVHLAKQTKIIKTAEYYLQYHTLSANTSCRFDVVAISPPVKHKTALAILRTFQLFPAQVEWVKNAFSR